jgi:pullulanase
MTTAALKVYPSAMERLGMNMRITVRAGLSLWIGVILAIAIAARPAFATEAQTENFAIGSAARAHWLSQDIIAWNVPQNSQVSIVVAQPQLAQADKTTQQRLIAAGLIDGALAEAYPHLRGMPIWKISGASRSDVQTWLKGRISLIAQDQAGRVLDRSRPQIGPVLDDLYANDETLGARFVSGKLSFALWAPTALAVHLHLFDDANTDFKTIHVMKEDPLTGIWKLDGKPQWNRKYYLYEVRVFVPETGRIITNFVTDPYTLSLSADSERTQVVNLDDTDLKPTGWDALSYALPDAPEDRALYELHVRDFSIGDNSVSPQDRGRYMAFARSESIAMRHLRQLAEAGLSDVHLLPTYDCATIPERAPPKAVLPDLSVFPANSEAQQAAIATIKDKDGFNWCYDPFHYMVPEGSYSSNASGITRIIEFRTMVKGLADIGLGTVLDVVFNHTMASGQSSQSVLDRIVPGYYHRLDENGVVTQSTCCANTASERKMMEKLMLDSLQIWAREYKISGFRFDLMGHHSRDNILKARERLRTLNLKTDGVDGKNIYIYGEGWNFGEVANNSRFVQATQINMGNGTGIGTFNDRIRDAIRGGGVGDKGKESVRKQGFASGLFTAPNSLNKTDTAARKLALIATDQIRAALAGTIANYRLTTADGLNIPLSQLPYNGSPFGYASDPQEIINYAEAHDNQTLFDSNAFKLPRDTSRADRVRWQNIAASIVILSQGVPFLHAGQELLRSKSLDHNSFNSGDWFNRLDFSKKNNGWGRGLPPFADNKQDWPIARELLADARLSMGQAEIARASDHVREMLQIRKTSPLFRLKSGQEVINNVHFNVGRNQIPGLIVMQLGKADEEDIVVIINATRQPQSIAAPNKYRYTLHDILKNSTDPLVRRAGFKDGTLLTPPLTTTVFVKAD